MSQLTSAAKLQTLFARVKVRHILVICIFIFCLVAALSVHRAETLAALVLHERSWRNANTDTASDSLGSLSLESPVQTCTPPTGIIISEFRLRGANGVNDEFFEFYNNTDQNATICAADGSNGWALVSSDGVVRFVIPAGTVIPARAHYLVVGSGYSLAAYATGDLTYTPDTPDNLGIALFATADPLNFTVSNRQDAVGFTTTSNALYREGSGLPTLTTANGQYSFTRKLKSGFPQDTGDNSVDFVFIATDAGNYGIIAQLGAPGPENLASPTQRNAQLPMTLLDPAVAASVAPNRVRDTTAIGPNAAAGTLTIRRTITNNTAGAVTRLRCRVVDITTLNTPGYVPGGSQADLRALSSNDTTVALSNGTQVLVRGTTVETPPAQPNGGGLNSSLGVFAFTLSQPLAPGATTNVQFVLGVQQGGSFRFFLNIEAAANSLPTAVAGGPYSGPAGSPIQFNGSGSFDLEGGINSYQWSFGDNTTATGPAPSHTYSSPGTYTVTLTVTDSIGLTTTGATTATIYPASNQLPVAYLGGPYSAVTGTATQFSGSGCFDPDGSIVQYQWDFAGLATASGVTASFTFTNTGVHLVSLTVTDNQGAKSSTSINVTVGVPPGQEQQVGDSTVSDWDQFNRRSLDDPFNDRGNTANKSTGNNNFQLVAPVLSLPGRGMDLNLNLVYNSLLWNKSGSAMYFDIDHDWPAPGWHLGFGKMVTMGTAGCLLIEPDGSRHAFTGRVFTHQYPPIGALPAVNVTTFKGQTTDGSLIEYRCEMQLGGMKPEGLARYPNGTVIYYTNYSTDTTKPQNYLYPYLIVDANGNRISIKYLWDLAEPRLERIVDSVGRVISFHYDTQKRLTAITAPGLRDNNGNPTTYTFVRLHYTTQPVNLSGAFAGATTHIRNSSPPALDAIYYPATGTGYWFPPDSYSSYGMLKKVSQHRGMTFVPGSTFSEQGIVTQGTATREQTYNYPATPASLASAPVFTTLTETWHGSTSPSVTNFLAEENSTTSERTVTVTNPDGTKTIQISFSLNHLADSDPNKFRNGLTKEEKKLDANGALIQKTVFTWDPGADGAPRLQKIEKTDERDQVLTTAYDQYGANNALGRMREFDYSNAVFRTTINTFVSYLDNDLDLGLNPTRGGLGIRRHPRRVNMVASTKVFQGDDSANIMVSCTESKFDEYAETLKAYAPDGESSLDLFVFGVSQQPGGIIGILQHSSVYNPLPPSQNDLNGGAGSTYITRRGNITSVTRFADTSNAGAPAVPIAEKFKYDMAGNVIATSKICCDESSTVYDNLATQYAFPISQTRGAADPNSLLRITTSATYDLSTGLLLSATNANGRTTQTDYFPNSLRPKEIISPTGSRVSYEYDDAAMKVVMTTRLSLNGTIAAQNTKYFNGLGQVIKEEVLGANNAIDIVETQYDQFGRPAKQSRPYRTGQTPIWRETKYDAAGRVSEHWEPLVIGGFQPGEGFAKTKYFYNEVTRPAGASTELGQTTRIVDPWNRWRWARVDCKGQPAEVVEPNPAGGTGFQTKYTHDVAGRLVRVEQGQQVRRFRYDGLGRMTHQKLAEKEATLNLAGQWTTTGSPDDRWSDVYTYDERSNIITHTDARGVKTNFNYKDNNNVDDPLNRLRSISYDTSAVPAGITVLPAATVTYQYRTKSSPSTLIDVTQIEQVVATIDATNVSTEFYDYDTEGRVREKRFTFGGRPLPMTTTYAYDALGRFERITYPEQYHDGAPNPTRKILIPSYDAASRPTALNVNNIDYASQITYNAANQMTSLLIGSGANQLTETYSYEERTGLLSSQTVKRGTTTLMGYIYQYITGYCEDPLAACDGSPEVYAHTGQVTRVTNTGPIGQWQYQHFSYDELGRLKAADQGRWIQTGGNKFPNIWEFRTDWNQVYSYDRYGNRTNVVGSNNSGVTPVAQDGSGPLAFDSTSNRITTAGFTYDAAGNQLKNNNGKSFLYDAAGRLAQVRDQAGATVLATYTYGSSNRRLITQTGNSTSTDKTYYIWEGDSVISEYVEQTTASMPKWSKNYIYLGARLLATETPNGSGEKIEYHHPDRLGTKLVTNNLDTTSVSQSNLPFGTALDAGVPGNTRRFTSYDRSATSGLDYAINRQYDPLQGRFTQPDPIGMRAASLADPQTLNMYTYVGNDPVNRVDPDGQFWGAFFRFIAGLFTSLRPNVINGSFTYRTLPPITVSFTPNFQNIGVSFAGVGFNVRSNGNWLPQILGQDLFAQLPLENQIQLDSNFEMLKLALRGAFGELRESCKTNVLDKLATIGFDKDLFLQYLDRGAQFYDGARSHASIALGIGPFQITGLPLNTTLAQLFAMTPGLVGITSGSFSVRKLTVFFRPGSIRSSVDSPYLRALLFHEALHGFGSFLTGGLPQGSFGSGPGSVFGRYSDRSLLRLFGFTNLRDTSQITYYIQKNCF